MRVEIKPCLQLGFAVNNDGCEPSLYVPAFENLANFHELPATGIYVVALPVKICGGSGGPLRIVAKVHDDIR